MVELIAGMHRNARLPARWQGRGVVRQGVGVLRHVNDMQRRCRRYLLEFKKVNWPGASSQMGKDPKRTQLRLLVLNARG